jgi:hypothetical protein
MVNDTPPSSTELQRWAGPERRRFDRTPPPPPQVIGHARLLPDQAWHSPGLDPTIWYPVLDGNPASRSPDTDPGA